MNCGLSKLTKTATNHGAQSKISYFGFAHLQLLRFLVTLPILGDVSTTFRTTYTVELTMTNSQFFLILPTTASVLADLLHGYRINASFYNLVGAALPTDFHKAILLRHCFNHAPRALHRHWSRDLRHNPNPSLLSFLPLQRRWQLRVPLRIQWRWATPTTNFETKVVCPDLFLLRFTHSYDSSSLGTLLFLTV